MVVGLPGYRWLGYAVTLGPNNLPAGGIFFSLGFFKGDVLRIGIPWDSSPWSNHHERENLLYFCQAFSWQIQAFGESVPFFSKIWERDVLSGDLCWVFEGGGNRPLHPFRPPWQLNWQAFHGSGLLHELFESPGRGPLWLPWEQDIAWELP